MKAVVTDFDGTITREDVAELLLQEFTGDAWREVERLHRLIGTRETLRRQFALVRATREEVLATAERLAELDPAFPPFLDACRARGIHIEIVSEGFDAYLGHLLDRWGLDIPFRTNAATWDGDRMTLAHPWEDRVCALCGTCKMQRVQELRVEGYEVAYVGNGISDICPALEADLVFAKDDLERLCREHGRAYRPFGDFGDVARGLAGWR